MSKWLHLLDATNRTKSSARPASAPRGARGLPRSPPPSLAASLASENARTELVTVCVSGASVATEIYSCTVLCTPGGGHKALDKAGTGHAMCTVRCLVSSISSMFSRVHSGERSTTGPVATVKYDIIVRIDYRS